MGRDLGSGNGVTDIKARVDRFLAQFGVKVPILLAPLSGAFPPALSIAVANAGGMGACGARLMEPAAIAAWVAEFRAGDGERMQMWAAQAAKLARAEPAGVMTQRLWDEALALLP